MCWIQSANAVVLLVVSIQSSDNFSLERRTLGLYIVLIQVVHTALWPLSTFLYLAQLKRHFRNTRAHRSCLSLSRSLCVCLCGAGDTLKARIWALIHLQGVWIAPRKCRPQSTTKVTSGICQSPWPNWLVLLAEWQNAFWEMIFSQRSCCHGWKEEEGEKPALSLAVARVRGQSCCGDLVLITGSFLPSAEHKTAPRKD